MSDNEQKVLDFIKQYKRTHQGTSPSYEDIARGCGFANRSTAKYYVDALEEMGKIVHLGTRNIQLLEPIPEAS